MPISTYLCVITLKKKNVSYIINPQMI